MRPRVPYLSLLLSLLLALLLLPNGATGLDAKWTNADDDSAEQLPMSKRYRDKLDELEAKVGPEKFKELTGMTPPSQTKSGRAASGQAVNGLLPALQKAATALVAAVQAASSHSLGSPHMVPIVAAATTVLAVVVTYKLWHHRDRTGFRVPLVKGHASLSPPPRRHIESWLRQCAEEEAAAAAAGDGNEDGEGGAAKRKLGQQQQYARRLLLGRGEDCFRCAQNALHALRMCEGDAAVELSNLDFVGLQRFERSHPPSSRKLAALLLPHGRLWWLLPFRVAREERGVVADNPAVSSGAAGAGAGGGKVVDTIELATLDRNAPWSGTVCCTLEWRQQTAEVAAAGGGAGGGGKGFRGRGSRQADATSSAGGVYFNVAVRAQSEGGGGGGGGAKGTGGKGASPSSSSSPGSSLVEGHAETVLEALTSGMDRVVARDMAAKAARMASYDGPLRKSGDGSGDGGGDDGGGYQSAADRALREKRRRERHLKLRRSDLLANHRFGVNNGNKQPGNKRTRH